jgi:hypothetical protein
MYHNSSIQIEMSPGTSIEEAFTEAIRISRILWIRVEFKFNGVTCWGYPNGDIKEGCDNFFKALESKSRYKFANS